MRDDAILFAAERWTGPFNASRCIVNRILGYTSEPDDYPEACFSPTQRVCLQLQYTLRRPEATGDPACSGKSRSNRAFSLAYFYSALFRVDYALVEIRFIEQKVEK
jgi:hypothetical protein